MGPQRTRRRQPEEVIVYVQDESFLGTLVLVSKPVQDSSHFLKMSPRQDRLRPTKEVLKQPWKANICWCGSIDATRRVIADYASTNKANSCACASTKLNHFSSI